MPFDEGLYDGGLNGESGGEEEKECEDDRYYDSYLDILVLLCLDGLEQDQLGALQSGTHLKQSLQDQTFHSGLEDAEQDDGSEDHANEDGVEENGLQPAIIVKDRHRDLIVAHHPVVNKHDGDYKGLHSDAEGRYLDHPHLYDIEGALNWLNGRHQRVYVDLPDVQDG